MLLDVGLQYLSESAEYVAIDKVFKKEKSHYYQIIAKLKRLKPDLILSTKIVKAQLIQYTLFFSL